MWWKQSAATDTNRQLLWPCQLLSATETNLTAKSPAEDTSTESSLDWMTTWGSAQLHWRSSSGFYTHVVELMVCVTCWFLFHRETECDRMFQQLTHTEEKRSVLFMLNLYCIPNTDSFWCDPCPHNVSCLRTRQQISSPSSASDHKHKPLYDSTTTDLLYSETKCCSLFYSHCWVLVPDWN